MKDEIVLYQPDETVKLEVHLKDETVWLTQQQIADLFGVSSLLSQNTLQTSINQAN